MKPLATQAAVQPGPLFALLLVALNLRPALASLGPVLESLRADLHLSYKVLGLFTSVSTICMGLFAPLTMPLHTRLGLKRTVLSMLLLLAVGTLLRVQATLNYLLLSSLLIGIAIALLGPLLNSYIKLAFAENGARVSGWVTTALCLGAALAAGSSAVLSRRLGWPLALGSWALLALAAAWQWQYRIPNPPQRQVRLKQRLPWNQLRAWLLMLVFGLNSLVFYGLLTWLAPAYMGYGLSAAGAGQLLGVFALVQIIGTLSVSALPTQQRERRPAFLVAGLCTIGGLLGVWQLPLTAPYLWVSMLGAGTAALFALTLILPLDYSDSPESAGHWTSMMSSGGYLIAACGPYLCGALRDFTGGYAAVFVALVIVGSAALLLSLTLGPIKSIAATHHELIH